MTTIESGLKIMSVEMLVLKDRDEWLENRFNGIGGSEISAVVGLNPYLDNVTLWEYKTGKSIPEDIGDKPFVKYGHSAEHHLRELFKLDFPQYQVFYEENNSFKNEKFPWALASLDGWLTDSDGRKGILEIKTTEILNSMHKEKWNDSIPQNYYCQTLLYMAVLEADFAVLKAQLKSTFLCCGVPVPYLQTKHFFIERSEVEEDIQFLMNAGQRFWEYVKKNVRPPLVLPNI